MNERKLSIKKEREREVRHTHILWRERVGGEKGKKEVGREGYMNERK